MFVNDVINYAAGGWGVFFAKWCFIYNPIAARRPCNQSHKSRKKTCAKKKQLLSSSSRRKSSVIFRAGQPAHTREVVQSMQIDSQSKKSPPGEKVDAKRFS
jgi:hypothetical protein